MANKFFADLTHHGTKLAKFKQDVLIGELAKRKLLTQDQEHIKVYGACAALCCMWLYAKLNDKKDLHRSEGLKIEESINLPFAKISVALQAEYMKDFDPNKWSERTTALYSRFDLVCEIDGTRHDKLGVVLGQGWSVMPHRPGVMVSLDVRGGTGHAIAMCQPKKGGPTYFFDPNAGEYEVTAAKAIKFLTEYAKAAPKALGKDITGGYRVAISRKT